MLIGELSKGDRQKIMTICTIDVHSRDVVAKLITQKVENSQVWHVKIVLNMLKSNNSEYNCF